MYFTTSKRTNNLLNKNYSRYELASKVEDAINLFDSLPYHKPNYYYYLYTENKPLIEIVGSVVYSLLKAFNFPEYEIYKNYVNNLENIKGVFDLLLMENGSTQDLLIALEENNDNTSFILPLSHLISKSRYGSKRDSGRYLVRLLRDLCSDIFTELSLKDMDPTGKFYNK